MTRAARAASAWLLGALAVGALPSCDGRAHKATQGAAGASHEEPTSGPGIAVLDLSDGAPEQAGGGLLGLAGKGGSFPEFVREVERLRGDTSVRGVLIRLGTARIGLARADEIGGLLAGLGSRIPVWCHANEYGNTTLYLAARGCKRVWVAPGSSVDAIGIAAQMVYFHKLLAEDIGLDVDFLQVGKFKGAEEPFTRDGPSPEARESLESTLADLRAGWIDGFHAGRPAVAVSAPEDGPYPPNGAKERGLVDDVGYFDDARDALERDTDAVRAEVRFGAGAPEASGGQFADILRTLVGDSLATAPVAVVSATGSISMDGGGGLGGDGGIVERHLVRTLKRLERDDDVRAVVLRIDSPGGSALASDLLWHALMAIRAKKVLVVSVGDMAASGGYYLASAGATVFADATSIVGSIGVVGGKIAADRALDRVGVHAETFAAKTGDRDAASRAAYDSLLTPWDAPTRARVLETMTGVYDLFLARVAKGRGIPVDRVAASAEGRIFSGRDGQQRGLVDELGGLTEAIVRARAMAGLPDDARFDVAEEPEGILRMLADPEPRAAAQAPSVVAGAMAVAVSSSLARIAPGLAPFAGSLASLVAGERVLCALPFALTVR
jgi:protease-4